jgi:hypothetical protein
MTTSSAPGPESTALPGAVVGAGAGFAPIHNRRAVRPVHARLTSEHRLFEPFLDAPAAASARAAST